MIVSEYLGLGQAALRRPINRLLTTGFSTLLWVLFCLGARADQSVSLAWDKSPDTNVVGYAVYYGNSSGAYDSRLEVGTNTVATVTVPGGLTYFFVATSYDADGLESEPSNEVNYSVPGVVDL